MPEPAVLKMSFELDDPFTDPAYPNTKFYFVDLSQCASILNRRFYRQGLQWMVSGMRIMDLEAANYTISKLPTTWTLANGWEKTFRAWNRQQREVLEDGDQESVRARFNDFKIFANGRHLAHGVANNLLPIDALSNKATPGEWEMSQIVIPNFGSPGTNYEPYIMGVGPNVGGVGGAYSVIELYEKSRSTPQSPDPAVPGTVLSTNNILSAMFDVGDNNLEVLTNVVGKNDDLPYDQDNYPGGPTQLPDLQVHSFEIVSATTVGGQTRVPGGVFPCGLIEIARTSTGPSTTPYMEIEIMVGNHRGYMAESMTEM